jgi:hypothetical protein
VLVQFRHATLKTFKFLRNTQSTETGGGSPDQVATVPGRDRRTGGSPPERIVKSPRLLPRVDRIIAEITRKNGRQSPQGPSLVGGLGDEF